MALVNINNSMAALARAVTESNEHLWVIAEYVDRLEWGRELDESDEGSEEWDLGDEHGWRLSMVWDGTQCVRFEHGDMEYRMYGSEFFG